MSPRTRYTFFIDADLRAGIAAIKERDGIAEAEQIRRALKAWIELKGVTKADRKRVGARERS